MTASKQAKAWGLKSVVELAKLSGAKESTLHDWVHTRPKIFETLCIGSRIIKLRNETGIVGVIKPIDINDYLNDIEGYYERETI